MTLIKDERKAVHNKQIGNRAGEMLLLSFCPRLNGSNSIQHLCLKSTPSPICQPLPATPDERQCYDWADGKNIDSQRTLWHICKPHKANTQTKACKRATILPTLPTENEQTKS